MNEDGSRGGRVTIRPAEAWQAAALAAFHVRIWRETYGGMAPRAAVEQLDESRRLPFWQAALTSPKQGQASVVAMAGETLAGVVSFGPPSQPVFAGRGEIKHLYVDAAHRGAGIGRRLMGVAFDALARAGFDSAALGVVSENAEARAFYRRLGGVELETFEDAGPLWKSRNILVAWPLPRPSGA